MNTIRQPRRDLTTRPRRTDLRRTLVRGALAGALLLVSVGLLLMVPRSSGSSWAQVAGSAGSVRLTWLVVVAAVWFAGMCAHSLVLTSALPGLSARRAIGLNLAGSAVANSVPFGGPASLAVTTAMAASWGFAPLSLGTFLAVSNIWNLLGRLAAGVLGLAWVAASLSGAGAGVQLAGWAAALTGLILVAGAALLVRPRVAGSVGAWAGGCVDRWKPQRQQSAGGRRRTWAMGILRLRRQVGAVVRASWVRMTGGMAGYLVLLALLLLLCLRALGTPQPVLLVASAVAVERLVTAVPLTPGGAGVAELALAAVLTLGGVAAADAVAATLLYRAFTFFLEIPVGLGVALAWGVGRSRGRRSALAGGAPS